MLLKRWFIDFKLDWIWYHCNRKITLSKIITFVWLVHSSEIYKSWLNLTKNQPTQRPQHIVSQLIFEVTSQYEQRAAQLKWLRTVRVAVCVLFTCIALTLEYRTHLYLTLFTFIKIPWKYGYGRKHTWVYSRRLLHGMVLVLNLMLV